MKRTQEDPWIKGTRILSRGRATMVGHATGANWACGMSGCTGRRMSIRWENGVVTRPCVKALVWCDINGWMLAP